MGGGGAGRGLVRRIGIGGGRVRVGGMDEDGGGGIVLEKGAGLKIVRFW